MIQPRVTLLPPSPLLSITSTTVTCQETSPANINVSLCVWGPLCFVEHEFHSTTWTSRNVPLISSQNQNALFSEYHLLGLWKPTIQALLGLSPVAQILRRLWMALMVLQSLGRWEKALWSWEHRGHPLRSWPPWFLGRYSDGAYLPVLDSEVWGCLSWDCAQVPGCHLSVLPQPWVLQENRSLFLSGPSSKPDWPSSWGKLPKPLSSWAAWIFPIQQLFPHPHPPPLLELSLHNPPSRSLETCAAFFCPRTEEWNGDQLCLTSTSF